MRAYATQPVFILGINSGFGHLASSDIDVDTVDNATFDELVFDECAELIQKKKVSASALTKLLGRRK